MSQSARLYGLAFFSGAAALAYEVSWTKWLWQAQNSDTSRWVRDFACDLP
jgi:hypothetical protein